MFLSAEVGQSEDLSLGNKQKGEFCFAAPGLAVLSLWPSGLTPSGAEARGTSAWAPRLLLSQHISDKQEVPERKTTSFIFI